MLVYPNRLMNPQFLPIQSGPPQAPTSDGNDGLILAGDNFSVGPSGEIMISVWVYPQNGFTTGVIFGTLYDIST